MGTEPAGSAWRDRAQASRAQIQDVQDAWAARHPDRAAEERELVLRQRDVKRAHRAALKADRYVDHGTAETLAKVGRVRDGALARLYHSGAITMRQWGASMEIASAHERVLLDVQIRSGWGFDRVDVSRDPEISFHEQLGQVRTEMTYTRWRQALPQPWAVLTMIVDDVGLDAAARMHTMHKRRAKRLLIDALELWIRMASEVREEIDDATLAAAHAGLLG